MKQYIKIDSNGYAIMLNPELPFNERGFDSLYIEDDEEIPEGYVETPQNGGFHHPRRTGMEWVEGVTQEELDTIPKPSQEPTEADYLIDLDFRVSKLELGI